MITKELRNELSAHYADMFVFIDRVLVLGKTSVTELYGLADASQTPNEVAQTMYQRAYQLYQGGQFEEAEAAFADLANQYQHRAASYMVNRCQQLAKKPPKNWQGVFQFEHK